MKKNVKLNGQLRLYVRWPLYLTLLLIGMNIWIYVISHDAGMVMAVFVLVYAAVAAVLYVSSRFFIQSWSHLPPTTDRSRRTF